MTSADEFRRRFDTAIRRADAVDTSFTAEADREAFAQLSADFRTACAALRDNLVERGLPGYPVVDTEDRAFLIGCWTDDDEDDNFDHDRSGPYSIYTYVLLTSGMATEARWLPERHAFAVAAEPEWLPLAVRRDYLKKYRLVSARTPFDCGDLIEHLTAVAVAGGRFYRYGTDLYLAQHPGDDTVAWDR